MGRSQRVVERSQRSIYAYCHVRTNQVLYSFSPILHNATVAKQFPDTGANTSFTHLRKDLWRPLWTLAIPEGQHADAQGRHAFKKLREWRKLHETSWEPPAMLSLNHSPKEIEKLQDQLDERGGSKKENVYDVIRHQKKKLRVNAVLDQRANSIADLAAVLADQENLGAQTQESKEQDEKSRREHQVKYMLELAADAENDGLKRIKARITELNKMMKSTAEESAEMSKSQMKRELAKLQTQRNKMRFSVNAVAEATKNVDQGLPPAEKQARIAQSLPNFPIPTNATIPKRGSLRARLARANAPVFSTSGIVVKWANHLDAEYAEAWPETIEHKPMGLTRYTAPKAEDEPVMDVASYKSKLQEAWVKAHPEPVPPKDDVSNDTRLALNRAKSSVLKQVKKAVAARAKELDRKPLEPRTN